MYNQYIILNFGARLIREANLNILAGTKKHRIIQERYGQVQIYKGTNTAKAKEVIEIFIPTPRDWNTLLRNGLFKYLRYFTLSGTSKFVILGHGEMFSPYFHSVALPPVTFKKVYGVRSPPYQPPQYRVSITDLAALIANSIIKSNFNRPENFFAITLWGCKTAATYAGATILNTMAAQLVSQLHSHGVYSRVRGSFTSLGIAMKEDIFSTVADTDSTSEIDLQSLDTTDISDRIKLGEILSFQNTGTLFTRAVMLLFLLNATDQVECFIARKNFPFVPDISKPNNTELINIILFISHTLGIIIDYLKKHSMIDRIQSDRRQILYEKLRALQIAMLNERSIYTISDLGKLYIHELRAQAVLTPSVAAALENQLTEKLYDEMSYSLSTLTSSDSDNTDEDK